MWSNYKVKYKAQIVCLIIILESLSGVSDHLDFLNKKILSMN